MKNKIENYSDDLGLEAFRSKVNPDVLSIKDDLGTKVANVNTKSKSVKVIDDTIDKAIRASRHSKNTFLDMINKISKLIEKYPKKFEKEDGEPDFKLHNKASKAANIIATPDGGKPIDTGIEVKSFSDSFDEQLIRLKTLVENNQPNEEEDNTVIFYIDNIDYGRNRFDEIFKDKRKYIICDNGYVTIPKSLFEYFTTTMNKAKISYSVVS